MHSPARDEVVHTFVPATPAHPVFKQPIDYDSQMIPAVIRTVVEYFDARDVGIEGLFRISASASELQKYITLFDEGCFDLSEVLDPHIPANLLKQYLRTLPEPLIPFEKYGLLIAVGKEQDNDELVRKAKLVLPTLPLLVRVTFKYLIHFLYRVTQHSDVNKMSPANIALVFAPNILRPRGDDIVRQMSDSGHANHLIQTLVIEYHTVFQNEPNEIDLIDTAAVKPRNSNANLPPVPARSIGSVVRSHSDTEQIAVAVAASSNVEDEPYAASTPATPIPTPATPTPTPATPTPPTPTPLTPTPSTPVSLTSTPISTPNRYTVFAQPPIDTQVFHEDSSSTHATHLQQPFKPHRPPARRPPVPPSHAQVHHPPLSAVRGGVAGIGVVPAPARGGLVPVRGIPRGQLVRPAPTARPRGETVVYNNAASNDGPAPLTRVRSASVDAPY